MANSIRFSVNEATGLAAVDFGGNAGIREFEAEVRLKDGRVLKSSEAAFHEAAGEPVEDMLGKGERIRYVHRGGSLGEVALTQELTAYEEGFATVGLTVAVGGHGAAEEDAAGERASRHGVVEEAADAAAAGGRISTNYMAPMVAGEDALWIAGAETGKLRFLSAPFDNDKWAKFVDYPLAYARESYEFTAIHPDGEKQGLVLGSIDHGNWKTGITADCTHLTAYSGAASEDTRDLNGIRHGFLTGSVIAAARIFIGWFDSYQDGFAAFGDCSAKLQPALPWDGPVVFGWNSWAAMMGSLTPEGCENASDFMYTIQDTYCGSDGNQYINYDAMWERFSNKVEGNLAHVRANGQHPGAYFCPFITGQDMRREVSGTGGRYFYEDIALRDENGEILPQVDGLYSLDPTHPGTLMHMEYELKKIISWGFDSIKTDFVGHGCREGVFYRKDITTGVQAFHFGMRHFTEILAGAGRPIFISLSIAPIFPHGYGHARRISCDAFGSLDQSEYLNNCITYLWWMNNRLYRFNDPDHIVTYKTYDKHSVTFEEGRTRYHAGVICGSLMITSDDYRIPEARERASQILTNEEINEIARKGESFWPLRVTQGSASADVFVRRDEDALVIAVFNYSISEEKEITLPLEELGLEGKCTFRDCWEKNMFPVENGEIRLKLRPAQSTILKVYGPGSV